MLEREGERQGREGGREGKRESDRERVNAQSSTKMILWRKKERKKNLLGTSKSDSPCMSKVSLRFEEVGGGGGGGNVT